MNPGLLACRVNFWIAPNVRVAMGIVVLICSTPGTGGAAVTPMAAGVMWYSDTPGGQNGAVSALLNPEPLYELYRSPQLGGNDPSRRIEWARTIGRIIIAILI